MNSFSETEITEIQSISDFDFPEYLKSISDAPSLLYFQGDISLISYQQRVAIVGTRTPSMYGIEEGRYFTKWFTERGFLIVSGLAVGIDTVVHQTCLEYGGKTVAVLPSGIGNIYPKRNQKLAKQIISSGGLLISEYPSDSPPKKYFFIQRDRIQSALSKGVVVIESDLNSGTMVTAGFAINQGKILGCVDYGERGDGTKSEGNRKLISTGKAFSLTRENLPLFETMLLKTV